MNLNTAIFTLAVCVFVCNRRFCLAAAVWKTSNNAKNTVLLPKCCPSGQAVGVGNCTETSDNFHPTFHVHEHNETAFDDVPISSDLITFNTFVRNPCVKKKFPLSPEENPIILLNGSLLLAGFGDYDGILDHDQFCIDNLKDNTNSSDSTVYAFICIREHKDGYPQWVFSIYISLITVSAMLFAAAALFFYRQDIQCIHKKSFVAYSFTMSATYILIILMQYISGGCKAFGLMLQFFLLISFAWFAILCFDLAWMIHFYQTKDSGGRFNYYVAVSAIYSTIFLIASFSNSFTPDIPSSFFKPQFQKTICTGFDAVQHKSSFYTALLSAVLISVLSLGYCLIKMNQNRYKNSCEGIIRWKKSSRRFRYMYGRLVIVFVIMLVWCLDSVSDRFDDNSGISVIILFIQAFQGFIVVPLFTTKSIRRAIEIHNKPRIENLQDLIEISKNYERA